MNEIKMRLDYQLSNGLLKIQKDLDLNQSGLHSRILLHFMEKIIKIKKMVEKN